MPLPADLPQQALRAEHAFTLWCLKAKAGHTLDHVLDPDYWVHLLSNYQMRVHDEIRVIAEDGSYFVHLLVEAIDERRMWAKMRVLFTHWDSRADAPAIPAKDPDGYTVEFSGAHKWRILTAAGQVAAKGLASEAEAREALANLKQAKAA